MSMTRAHRAITVIVGVLALSVLSTGCLYERHPVWSSLTPEQQAGVRAHEQKKAAAGSTSTCLGAMRAVWPQHLWKWGEAIQRRESGLQPRAANPASSARGCWQMLMSLHGKRFTAVGCSPAQWGDALCNNKAAYLLYKQAGGPSPWRL